MIEAKFYETLHSKLKKETNRDACLSHKKCNLIWRDKLGPLMSSLGHLIKNIKAPQE
jgi:hypothetical protein